MSKYFLIKNCTVCWICFGKQKKSFTSIHLRQYGFTKVINYSHSWLFPLLEECAIPFLGICGINCFSLAYHLADRSFSSSSFIPSTTVKAADKLRVFLNTIFKIVTLRCTCCAPVALCTLCRFLPSVHQHGGMCTWLDLPIFPFIGYRIIMIWYHNECIRVPLRLLHLLLCHHPITSPSTVKERWFANKNIYGIVWNVITSTDFQCNHCHYPWLQDRAGVWCSSVILLLRLLVRFIYTYQGGSFTSSYVGCMVWYDTGLRA